MIFFIKLYKFVITYIPLTCLVSIVEGIANEYFLCEVFAISMVYMLIQFA